MSNPDLNQTGSQTGSDQTQGNNQVMHNGKTIMNVPVELLDMILMELAKIDYFSLFDLAKTCKHFKSICDRFIRNNPCTNFGWFYRRIPIGDPEEARAQTLHPRLFRHPEPLCDTHKSRFSACLYLHYVDPDETEYLHRFYKFFDPDVSSDVVAAVGYRHNRFEPMKLLKWKINYGRRRHELLAFEYVSDIKAKKSMRDKYKQFENDEDFLMSI